VHRQNRNELNLCVKRLQYFRVDNMSTESLLNTRSKLALTRNLLKCNSDFTKKSHLAANLLRKHRYSVAGCAVCCRV